MVRIANLLEQINESLMGIESAIDGVDVTLHGLVKSDEQQA